MQSSTISVSVVIPVYNAAVWLAETLRSVASQTFPPDRFEVIVVDNGSTDGSPEVAEAALRPGAASYQVIHEPRLGVATARNKGALEARADWIQFLDGDDILHPEKLARQYRAAAALPEPYGVVYSSWQKLILCDGTWTPEARIECPTISSDKVASLLGGGNFLHLGSQLLRRSAFLSVGGIRESIGIIEDVDLALRLAMHGVEFVPCDLATPLFFYRKHKSGSLSTSDHVLFMEGCVRNARLAEEWSRVNGCLTAHLRSALVSSYFQAARFYAGRSWPKFEEMAGRISALEPQFRPAEPHALRHLSRVVGYRAAERVATRYRAAKRLFTAGRSS